MQPSHPLKTNSQHQYPPSLCVGNRPMSCLWRTIKNNCFQLKVQLADLNQLTLILLAFSRKTTFLTRCWLSTKIWLIWLIEGWAIEPTEAFVDFLCLFHYKYLCILIGHRIKSFKSFTTIELDQKQRNHLFDASVYNQAAKKPNIKTILFLTKDSLKKITHPNHKHNPSFSLLKGSLTLFSYLCYLSLNKPNYTISNITFWSAHSSKSPKTP